ncbi:MAG TPA: lactate permease LctP family transporter [Terracidiphilus sp.]|jgi:lactate permease
MGNTPPIWHQTYSLFGEGLGVSAMIAALPIFILLLLLGILRRPAWMAGIAGLAAAFALAIFGYQMPVKSSVSAALYGSAFGLFPISWIIYWAIALFRVTTETGKFEIIRDSVGRLTPDPRLQALLIAFSFGAFLEGGAGFGTPVAIAATMLTGLGFSAFSASAICLLANTAPVAFGSIGIPVITLAGTTGLALNKLSGDVGMMCSPVAFFLPAYLIIAMGGFGAMSGIWLPTIVAGLSFGVVQILVSYFMGPQLSAILAAVASMVSLILILRFRNSHRSGETESTGAEFARVPGADLRTIGLHDAPVSPRSAITKTATHHSPGEVLYAWVPYALLVTCVVLWGVAPIQRMLNKGTIVFGWPCLNDVVVRMPPVTNVPSPYHAFFTFNFFSAAGTACMVATFLAAICLRVSIGKFVKIMGHVTRQMALPIATVALVLGIGFLMNYCGATATLGLAFASTGKLFPFFSPLLGLLGVFLTGSDTSSNALFGNLQVVTANRLGLDPVLMAAANASGGVMGKMISLQTIAVAAAATGLTVRDQSKLFRFTLRHSLLLVFIIGCLALFYTYVLHI